MPVFDWRHRVDASEEEIPSLDNSYFEVEEKNTDARSGGLSGVLRGCVLSQFERRDDGGKGKEKVACYSQFCEGLLAYQFVL